MLRLTLLGVVIACTVSAQAPAPPPDPVKTVQDLARGAETAAQYAFEGTLLLAGQRAPAPAKILAQAKVRLAVGPEGKYFLRVEPLDKDEYLLISNGEKSWAFVPRLKQYTEEETAALSGEEGAEGDDDSREGESTDERDLAETFTRQVIPILAQAYKTASAAAFAGEAEARYAGTKHKWPVLRVLSKTDPQGARNMIELTLDPVSLTLGRFVWATARPVRDEKEVIRLTLDFSRFQIGEVLPASTFEFTPPKGAKLVDAVPIPGQSGSFLLSHSAPDFELKTLDGEKIRLAALRGRPVLLNFWATWCGPCRREMPAMAKLYDEYKSRGLVVLGVNDEGKAKARKFVDAAEVPFQILDDTNQKAYRLFHVRAIPAVFLIDSDGKVVRFLRGSHDYAALQAALKAVGL